MRSLVKARLSEMRMSQKELARRVGVSKDTVWRWTTDGGMAGMTLRRAADVAGVLGCEIEGRLGIFEK